MLAQTTSDQSDNSVMQAVAPKCKIDVHKKSVLCCYHALIIFLFMTDNLQIKTLLTRPDNNEAKIDYSKACTQLARLDKVFLYE